MGGWAGAGSAGCRERDGQDLGFGDRVCRAERPLQRGGVGGGETEMLSGFSLVPSLCEMEKVEGGSLKVGAHRQMARKRGLETQSPEAGAETGCC